MHRAASKLLQVLHVRRVRCSIARTLSKASSMNPYSESHLQLSKENDPLLREL